MFSYHFYRRGKQKQRIKKIKIKISLHFCLKCLAYVHLCDFCLFESDNSGVFQGGAQPLLKLANHVFWSWSLVWIRIIQVSQLKTISTGVIKLISGFLTVFTSDNTLRSSSEIGLVALEKYILYLKRGHQRKNLQKIQNNKNCSHKRSLTSRQSSIQTSQLADAGHIRVIASVLSKTFHA